MVEGANISWSDVLKNIKANAFTFSPSEAATAKLITDTLSAKIASVVASMHDPHLHFVPANYTGSPFVGHTLCTQTPYFNGFYVNFANPLELLGDTAMSFHPNHSGTAAYEKVFAAYLKSHR